MNYEHNNKRFKNKKIGLYLEVIKKSSDYINIIIDYYINQNSVKLGKIGLLGFSMGGFVVFN